MKPQTVLIAGAFSQCALAVLAIAAVVVGVIWAIGCFAHGYVQQTVAILGMTVLAVGLFVAVGCVVEGACAAVQFERED